MKAVVTERLMYRHWMAYDPGTRSHLFVVRADGSGAPRDLTAGLTYDVPPGPYGGSEAYRFSPDGRELAYTYEVVELVPDERLVMRTAEGPFPMETSYTWRATGPSATQRRRNSANATAIAHQRGLSSPRAAQTIIIVPNWMISRADSSPSGSIQPA